MHLKSKITLILLLIITIYTLMIYGIQQAIILPSYTELEDNEAKKDIERVVETIKAEIEFLDKLAFDWAAWDDTYEFVQNTNPEYIKSNLPIETFIDNNLNIIGIYNLQKKPVWIQIYNLETLEQIQDHTFLTQCSPQKPSLFDHKTEKSLISGFCRSKYGPIMIASRPIITSSDKGPIKGTLIMGRFLTKELIAKLRKQTRIDLNIYPIEKTNIVTGKKNLLNHITKNSSFFIDKVNKFQLNIYTTFSDIKNIPAILIKINFNRDLTAKGYRTTKFSIISIIIAGVIIMIVITIIMQLIIVSPLSKLTEYAKYINQSEDLSKSITYKRKDEIGILSREFNHMVKLLRSIYKDQEQLITKRTIELETTNTKLQSEISKQTKTQQELIKAKKEAEHASQIKSHFLANMSHEIRTPMNGVIGMAQLLLNTKLTKEQHDYVRTILSSADLLLVVINDVLDFSKIEAGELEIDIITFDLRQILYEISDLISIHAKSKGLNFNLSIDENIPSLVSGDPTRLKQILFNLVSNAVKFTHNGGIKIETSIENTTNDNITIKFQIQDTGIGISKENMDNLFQEFSQLDSSMARKYGGTGLGLAISKQLAELMGGKISVESELYIGSNFWFTIVFNKQTSLYDENSNKKEILFSSSTDNYLIDNQQYKLLLVEDNLVNQKIIIKQLQYAGYIVDTAINGKKAIEALIENQYHLVLMDIQMPEMDGFTATNIIRDPNSNVLNHNIPIIAMTAHAMQGYYQKCIQQGMNDYIAKPIIIENLLYIIKQHLKRYHQ